MKLRPLTTSCGVGSVQCYGVRIIQNSNIADNNVTTALLSAPAVTPELLAKRRLATLERLGRTSLEQASQRLEEFELLSLMIVAITHPEATEQDRVRALKGMERVLYIFASEATLDKERIEISLDRSPTDWDETDEKLMQQFQHDCSTLPGSIRH